MYIKLNGAGTLLVADVYQIPGTTELASLVEVSPGKIVLAGFGNFGVQGMRGTYVIEVESDILKEAYTFSRSTGSQVIRKLNLSSEAIIAIGIATGGANGA